MRSFISALVVLTATLPVFAQEAAAAAGKGNMLTSMLPMFAVMFVVIYFLMIRPEQKKTKERQNMIKELQKGDRVLLAAGIYGTVGAIKDTTIMVKVSENAVIEVTKPSIVTVLNDDGTEKKPVSVPKNVKGDEKKEETKEEKKA